MIGLGRYDDCRRNAPLGSPDCLRAGICKPAGPDLPTVCDNFAMQTPARTGRLST